METDAGGELSAPAHYLPLCSPGRRSMLARFAASSEEERERETSRETSRERSSREIVLGRCVSVCAHARVYADWNRRSLLPRPHFFIFLNFPIVLTKVEKSARLNCELCASRVRTIGNRVSRREEGNSNSNWKTLILKDSSVRSIWTYLTASPCYTLNTNKHD